MPDEDVKLVAKPRGRAANYLAIYANGTIMGFSQWDIQITLSQAAGIGNQTIEDVATIVQSPVHAKAMLRALERTVAAYEAQYGVIPEARKPEPTKALAQSAPKRARRAPPRKTSA